MLRVIKGPLKLSVHLLITRTQSTRAPYGLIDIQLCCSLYEATRLPFTRRPRVPIGTQ